MATLLIQPTPGSVGAVPGSVLPGLALGSIAPGVPAGMRGPLPLDTQATTRHRARIQAPRSDPDPLRRLLRDPRERHELKLDLAIVLRECGRRAAEEGDYQRAHWFDERAVAVEECATVRVLPHRGCASGGGAATPLSCHVRGEPDCERVRAGLLGDHYLAHAARGTSPKMLTLTTRNVAQGELAAGLDGLGADFAKLRRRAIFAGGACRARWPGRGPTGELDGAPRHPCHVPAPAADCRRPRCAPGCPTRRRTSYAEHLPGCERGCPTRTGLRQSHCGTHRPRVTHPDGCPPSCAHFGHRRDRNCPAFRHAPIAGGVASTDLTFNEAEHSWHPHLHMLLDGAWLDWAELVATWRAITCRTPGCRHERLADGSPDPACTGSWMVWIAAVPADGHELRGAVSEVLKYVTKPHGVVDSLDPERIGEYVWATRGRRAVSGWGTFAGASLEARCPKACPPECPKARRKWCPTHDCPNARRRRCATHRPLGEDVIEIPGWFGIILAPRVCPSCGANTTADDWAVPFARSRLEAFRSPTGHYGWRPPPHVH